MYTGSESHGMEARWLPPPPTTPVIHGESQLQHQLHTRVNGSYQHDHPSHPNHPYGPPLYQPHRLPTQVMMVVNQTDLDLYSLHENRPITHHTHQTPPTASMSTPDSIFPNVNIVSHRPSPGPDHMRSLSNPRGWNKVYGCHVCFHESVHHVYTKAERPVVVLYLTLSFLPTFFPTFLTSLRAYGKQVIAVALCCCSVTPFFFVK